MSACIWDTIFYKNVSIFERIAVQIEHGFRIAIEA